MICSETLGCISNLRDMKDDYGVIPVPKYDEATGGLYLASGELGNHTDGRAVLGVGPVADSHHS